MTEPATPTQPLPGLLARVIGVIVSPRATFERLVQTPKILAMLVLLIIAAAIGSSAFTFTQAGQQALVDLQVQQTERLTGQPVNDAQVQRLEQFAPYQPYIGLGGAVIGAPIIVAVFAGVFFLVFNIGMGGTATFRQVYSIVVHAGVISILGLLFAVPFQFVRGAISVTGPANLGMLVPMLPENSFLSNFLGSIDLFRLWWTVVIAIGLGVLYRRSWRPITVTLIAIYLIYATVVALIFHAR